MDRKTAMQIRLQTAIKLLLAFVGIVVLARFMVGFMAIDKARQHYSTAVKFDNSFDEESAVRYYSKAIQLSPHFVKAYVARCSALTALGRYDEAIADCDYALELDTYSARGYANRCIVYAEIGELGHASRDCETALDLLPADGYVLASMGRFLSDKGELEKAVAYYDQALEKEPGYETAYYNRGRAYQRLGENKRAAEDFRQACSMNTNFFDACEAVVYICFEIGETDVALQEADRLIAGFPDRARSYYARGWIYNSIKDIDSAISDYKRAIEVDATFEDAYWGLGNLYYSLDDNDMALLYYCKYRGMADDPDTSVLEQMELLGDCPSETE